MMDFISWLKALRGRRFIIDCRESLEEAASMMGILPFFPNCVRGLSVQEMCAPGMLFGGNYDEGCWEWKGPVIRRKTSAYGKFFQRKAGFVSLDLLSDFLNYRRYKYPVKPFSTEEMLLDIIRENGDITSTELKNYIFGGRKSARTAQDLPDIITMASSDREYPENHPLFRHPSLVERQHPSQIECSNPSSKNMENKRKGLEGPLQRLQMGGWILISDFEYKKTKKGERYGWGVARYSTPEYNFNDNFNIDGRSPEESLQFIIDSIKKRFPSASSKSLRSLLK